MKAFLIMKFKEWLKLQEVGTGTNAIATFARPIFAEPHRRGNMGDKKKTKGCAGVDTLVDKM